MSLHGKCTRWLLVVFCCAACQSYLLAQNTQVEWGTNGNSSELTSDQGGSIELGSSPDGSTANPITGGVPFIDFHYGNGLAQDYNYRIINDGDLQLSFQTRLGRVLELTTGAIFYGDINLMHGPEGLGSGGGGTPVLRFFDGSEMIQAPPVLSSGDGVSVVVTTGHLSRTATFSADSSVARRSVAQTFTGNQTILGNLILGENGSSGGGISANGGLAVSNNYNGVIIQGTCINIGICMDLNQSGQIHTTGGFYTGGADFAESVAVNRSVKYDPGDVIVIDTTKGRQFTISTSPYSKLVAGVYSTRPGVVASNHPMNGAAFKGEIPLAVVGIVPCKVTSENGPIYPGDLLVSSSIPGYAMKGTNTDKMENAVLGKALGTLSSNVGVIEILVTVR